ncbi:MAG TPA: MFS transporter [Candidatus Dormibacteraeota bacterium]|nr:MFS transporter [Candidatus Dormibacteraeota bacterium]
MKLEYKWIALINTTIGMLMASINQTIVMIGLPAIFSGLRVDPLAPGASSLLIWIMIGNAAVTTMLLVSFGRLADMFGRVRLYNLGFVVFTVGSLLCALTPSTGTTGALELIGFRVVQAVGGAMVFSNSVAILTDAFPLSQRGLSLGINQIAFIGGNVIGVVLGGLVAAINWRLDFLISVPVGVVGSIWAFRALREIGVHEVQPPDWLGNVTFALGLLALVFGLTEALMPFGASSMGWSNPTVLASLALGVLLLSVFVLVESRVPYPMFNLALFRIRGFLCGNIAAFLFSLARGGLQFMLIIWLQGIWLPLHGVRYEDTPLQAGIDIMPMMVGFVICGPLGGWLSDRYGARVLATVGILIAGLAAALLTTLPADFNLVEFAGYLMLMGAGMGLFSAPNTSQIMGSLPAEHRGSGAGMRATVLTAGMTASQAVFFTIVIGSLSRTLGPRLSLGAAAAGMPAQMAQVLASLPAGAAIFAALLGYNPIVHLVPAPLLASLPPPISARVSDPHFFAGLLAQPFVEGIHTALAVCLVMCAAAGAASVLRGAARGDAPDTKTGLEAIPSPPPALPEGAEGAQAP